MRPSRKRRIVVAAGLVAGSAAVIAGLALVAWRSLHYEPDFYRRRAEVPRDRLRAGADRFISHSLQLRNDIANEGRWEAAFSDDEVNAWLAEDLVAHFDDYIPPGVREPLVAFEQDRVTFAFKLDRGRLTSVVWVVARARVPEDNTVALTLEKIRAGAFPIPPEEIIGRINEQALLHGLEIRWAFEDGQHVAFIRYSPEPERGDVVLERVRLLDGRIYIAGRSDHKIGRLSRLSLPGRRVLQMTFPRRPDRPRRSPST